MIELIKMEGMIVVSNNNFKDDFEKNRQSINPDEQQTELKQDDKTNENKKEADSQNS
ncbi:peptigoglycan-binding protein LysM, partial [Xylophilus sp. Kf1]|nr:peptigoglycan-binding protein LysM [Xylophilus sp. Kf1]